MPNHCFNQIIIESSSDDVENILDFLRNESTNTMFDFNKLVPMPQPLQDLQYVEIEGERCYYSLDKWEKELNGTENHILSFPGREWLMKNTTDSFTILRLEREHGTASWYEWCCAHWGTKWNAYDVEYKIGPLPGPTTIKNGKQLTYNLTTAWSEPRPIIRALMGHLSSPGFHRELEMRWRFHEEADNFSGELSLDNYEETEDSPIIH